MAASRLGSSGANTIQEKKKRSVWFEYLEELTEPMILLLLFIGFLYSITGELIDAVTIFAVIVALVTVEVFNDIRAERTIQNLNQLAALRAMVRRGGREAEVPAEDVVPGDIVILETGRKVPADVRLIESYGLAVDESLLTGESVPVEKSATTIKSASLSERTDMSYSGTVVARGRGLGVVVATGMNTELGRLAGLARGQKPPKTILQKTMNDLTKWMVVLAAIFSILVPLLGWLVVHQDLKLMFLTGLSLAFATIPEELPIIITMVLALGGYRLSRKHAIIKRLQAVETLGAVTVICSDKTGTLTSNREVVVRYWPAQSKARMLELGALANDARESEGRFIGDPVDVALMDAAIGEGIDVRALKASEPIVTERSFDNVRKRMSVVSSSNSHTLLVVKGSPESIIEVSSRISVGGNEEKLGLSSAERVRTEVERMAQDGLRVLAFGERSVSSERDLAEDAESDLTFVGLVGLADPPRPEVKEAIRVTREAGIRTIMLTGDHPLTADVVAGQVGLSKGRSLTGQQIDAMDDERLRAEIKSVAVCARVTPEHKLRIVKALQADGERVAVTGDGVNDAPALAAADIGIAMGQGGTDVARESSDMVLTDNNFATITGAVREGRVLFANLRKGVRYYLACKVALIAVALFPVLLLLQIPFTPVQIILLELFMDLGASAAFVAERAEEDLMARPPRNPKARFLDGGMVSSIFVAGASLAVAVSAAYLITLGGSGDLVKAQTMAFVTWLFAHFFLALNMRSEHEPLSMMGPLSNRVMVLWGVSAAAFAVIATELPAMHQAIKTASLNLPEWGLVIALAILCTFWMEAYKLVRFRSRPFRNSTAVSDQPEPRP